MKPKFTIMLNPRTMKCELVKLIEVTPGAVIAPNNELAPVRSPLFDTPAEVVLDAQRKASESAKVIDDSVGQAQESIKAMEEAYRALEAGVMAHLNKAKADKDLAVKLHNIHIAKMMAMRLSPEQIAELPVMDYTERKVRDEWQEQQA